jgi:hypothetical protein
VVILTRGGVVSPEIIAAFIGGLAAIVAAVIGAVVRNRSGRQKKADTSSDRVILPPPVPDVVRSAPAEPPPDVVRPAPAEPASSGESVPPGDVGTFDLQGPMPPLHPLPERYKGLTGEDLLVAFLADAEMSRKPDDTFKIVED